MDYFYLLLTRVNIFFHCFHFQFHDKLFSNFQLSQQYIIYNYKLDINNISGIKGEVVYSELTSFTLFVSFYL